MNKQGIKLADCMDSVLTLKEQLEDLHDGYIYTGTLEALWSIEEIERIRQQVEALSEHLAPTVELVREAQGE